MTNALSNEQIAALLQLDAQKEVRSAISLICDQCDSRLDNGYCRNESCSVDSPIHTRSCPVCGHCSSPGMCVASVTCPQCEASPSSLCVEGNKLVGYHEERWLLVKAEYGVYYK